MTLTADLVIATAIAYVGLLFLIAFLADRHTRNRSGGFLRSPFIVFGALIMALMIGWELKPKFFADEIKQGSDGKVMGFWGVCMKFIVPIVMLFVLFVQVNDFFGLGLIK